MKELGTIPGWKDRFPEARLVFRCASGGVFAAQDGDRFFLISDESFLADLLLEEDDDLVPLLVQVREFDSADERSAYIETRGWVRKTA